MSKAGFDIDQFRKEFEVFETDILSVQRYGNNRWNVIYNNMPCHLENKQAQNIVPASEMTIPLVDFSRVHYDDKKMTILHNDFLIATRLDGNGRPMRIYQGRCNNPQIDQGGAHTDFIMRTYGDIDSVPSEDMSIVTINFFRGNSGDQMREPHEIRANIGDTITIGIPSILGYTLSELWIDDVPILAEPEIQLTLERGLYIIQAIYEEQTGISFFRQLLSGMYQTDSGNFENGYHLFKKLDFEITDQTADGLTCWTDSLTYNHKQMGQIRIQTGSIFKAFMSREWFRITSIVRSGGRYRMVMENYTPTPDQLEAAVITGEDGF